MEKIGKDGASDSGPDSSAATDKAPKVRRNKKGGRIYALDDFKKMDEFILPPEPEWAEEWERRTGLKAQN